MYVYTTTTTTSTLSTTTITTTWDIDFTGCAAVIHSAMRFTAMWNVTFIPKLIANCTCESHRWRFSLITNYSTKTKIPELCWTFKRAPFNILVFG